MQKIIVICALVLVIYCQTSITYAAVNNNFFRADKQYYDTETGQHVVTGNIVITVGDGIIKGDTARVKLSTLEFWGIGAWQINQYNITFKGESVYVIFGKTLATIEGGVDFRRDNLRITADKVAYNWKSRVAEFSGNVLIVKGIGTPESLERVRYNVQAQEFLRE